MLADTKAGSFAGGNQVGPIPTFVAASSGGGTTVTLPAGTAEGDLVLIVTGKDGSITDISSSGWILAFNASRLSSEWFGTNYCLQCLYRIVPASPVGPVISFNGGNQHAWTAVTYRGVDVLSPIESLTADVSQASATSYPVKQTTTLDDNRLVLNALSLPGLSNLTHTVSSPYIERVERYGASDISVSDTDQAISGLSASGTHGKSGSQGTQPIIVALAIKPSS